MNDELDGYEAHLMGTAGVYVENPIHDNMRMRQEQALLAYQRSQERIDKMTTADILAAYRAGDQPFKISY